MLDVRHGVMMVGPSGSGKSSAWRTLLKALTRYGDSFPFSHHGMSGLPIIIYQPQSANLFTCSFIIKTLTGLSVILISHVLTPYHMGIHTYLSNMSRVDGSKGDFYIIDPKSIGKDKLYGSLDPNTLEWTDGIFTRILRKIIDNAQNRGGSAVDRRSWIVFDGDVDPEWAENLNSVLDDNKILTLVTFFFLQCSHIHCP